jgi:hypothetical protein
MPELVHPTEEKACQLRASGKTQLDAYSEAFGVPEDSKANNSSRFFRRADVRVRVTEIKNRRAVLADLDDGWVLKRLKRLADVNLDDYFAHDQDGRRTHIDLADVPRDKMAALAEIFEETTLELDDEDKPPREVRKVRVKPIPPGQALELIGKWLGMWPNKIEHSGDPNKPMLIERIEVVIVDPAGENSAGVHAAPGAIAL